MLVPKCIWLVGYEDGSDPIDEDAPRMRCERSRLRWIACWGRCQSLLVFESRKGPVQQLDCCLHLYAFLDPRHEQPILIFSLQSCSLSSAQRRRVRQASVEEAERAQNVWSHALIRIEQLAEKIQSLTTLDVVARSLICIARNCSIQHFHVHGT